MKFKNIFIATSVIALSFTSCAEGFLEDLPSSAIVIDGNNALATKSDLELAVNGLYGKLNSASALAANHQTYQELTGDLAFVGISNSGRFTQTNGWGHINADEGAGTGIWNQIYGVIANANFILEYEGKIASQQDAEEIAELFAHAYAIRAYCYSVLMQYFAPNFGDANQNLGVPYPTTFDINAKLPRSTVNEVYNGILSDLTAAKTNMLTNNGNKKFNPETIDLLTARVYLYMKNYPKAIEFADLALNGPTPLLTRAQVNTYFGPVGENASYETLFQIYESANENPGSNEAISATWSSVGTYHQNWMRRSFWQTFPSTDIRKTAWYPDNAAVNALMDDPKPIDVRKYVTPSRDVVLFRKTEAKFIQFEALYHTNPSAAATELFNWVKTYRDTGYVLPATSGQALLDEILRQKGFEFFLEGHRFTDLKRNHKPVDKTGQNSNTFVAAADYYKFIWPIPISEMQTNPNVVQNPGY